MFIARTLLNVLLLGAAVYAQQPSPTQQPVLSATDTRTMMLPTTSTLASGVSIPAPTNQDRLPINSATARLKTNTTTNSIILTVVIAEADSQRTPAEDMKLVNLTGTGFTPSDAKIYRLAVHTGIAADGDCNNGAIGAMLDPDNVNKTAVCDPLMNIRSCAIGDWNSRFGYFNTTKNGTVSLSWSGDDLPLNGATNRSLLNHMIMLYNKDTRIACGVIKADNSTIQIPQPTSFGISLHSSSYTTMALGAAMMALVLAMVQ